MRYIISLCLLLTSLAAFAQQEAENEKPAKTNVPDSLKADFVPTGIRFGVDALGLAFSLADENIDSRLFVADIDFHRYFFVGEFGQYERTHLGENGSYTTSGNFWRIGVDVNFFKYDPWNSVFSIGLRYGKSNFDDELSTTIGSDVYGDRTVTFTNNGLSADWVELVAGLKVPVWKIWLGYNMRMKLGIDSFEELDFSPYEVPGYGLAAEKDYWEINYYIMYRIEWKDKKGKSKSSKSIQ